MMEVQVPELGNSAVSDAEAIVPAVGGATPVAVTPPIRPAAHAGTVLEGVRIPSRNREVRRLVVSIYVECSHLGLQDLRAVTRYADLSNKYRRLAEHLDATDVVKSDGEVRKALDSLRALAGELRLTEGSLGVTAASRASLGLTVGKMQDLASLMANREQ